jgi:hypothetical protein
MIAVLAGANVGVLDALGLAPSASWNVRLYANNGEVQLANDGTTTDRGYPLNLQITMPNGGEEIWVRNNDSNDGIAYAMATEIV